MPSFISLTIEVSFSQGRDDANIPIELSHRVALPARIPDLDSAMLSSGGLVKEAAQQAGLFGAEK